MIPEPGLIFAVGNASGNRVIIVIEEKITGTSGVDCRIRMVNQGIPS